MTSKVRDTMPLSFELRGDHPARLDFTLLLEKQAGILVAKVIAGYLKLEDRKGPVAKTLSFDDARAVLDLNAKDQVLGIELLSGDGPYSLTELWKFVLGSKDPLLGTAANMIVA